MIQSERNQWLSRPPREELSRKLRLAAWILSGAVLVLVGIMRRPEWRIPLPEGVSFSFLPPVHAALNSLVSLFLILSLLAIRKGKVTLHKNAMLAAMGLSAAFLLCYVAYHFTTEETRFGGSGWIRPVYFFLLITHIVLAGVSLPGILFTFIAGWTNHFTAHRKLAKWVYPVWLYVAITGPICYFLLKPYY